MFVITGGGTGIGFALAKSLVDRNEKVLIVGRRLDVLKKSADYSPLLSFLCADVSNQEGRDKLVTYLHNFSSIKALIHNAGIITPIKPIEKLENSAWNCFINTNLSAPFFLSQLLLEKLKGGRVLHIGSGAAYFPVAGWAGYCVTKAALSMLTKCWQLELSDPAFASVMPGIVDTDMQKKICNDGNDFMEKEKYNFFKKLRNDKLLLNPIVVGSFLSWLLMDIDKQQFSSKEWDIYDKSHHCSWLLSSQRVPMWQ